MTKIPCTETVIKAGSGFVNVRHAGEKMEPQLLKLDAMLDSAIAGLADTHKDLKAAGMKRMQFGEAEVKLFAAKAAVAAARSIPGLVMAAHEHMANGLTAINMEQPTDEQLLPHLIDAAKDWR